MTDTGPNHFSSSLEKYSIPQRRDPGTSKGILPQSIRVMNLQTDNTNQTPLASGSGPSSISSDTMTGRLEKLSLNAEDAELPQLAFPNINISASASLLQARTDPFSVHNLAVGLQQAPYEAVNGYLESYEHEHIVTALNTEQVYEWPPIFFAAARNDPRLVRMVLAYDQGAKIANARSRSHKIPILASAVMEGARSAQSTVEVIKVLLAANADPCSIPKDLWTRYWTRPRAMKDQDDDDLSSDSERECGDCARTITKSPTTEAWCTPALRTKLASSLDISQRYCLWKAFQQPPQMARATHADKLLSLSTLREIPYYLVGQDIAARTVSLSIFSHVAHKDREPLTLVFCGPSGHGKTELAQRLAKIHGVEFAFVDTAGLRSTHDLLGGTASYKNSEQGSVLNNHLAKFSGKPSIAFLDEIDKTDDEVIEALLLITGSGKYTDRRSGTEVDCSTTIFIMATNEGDGIIERFYARKMAHLPEEKKASVKIEPLLLELRAKFIGKFGAPFTGRIKSIVPFFPFSEGEQMVVAHEFILEMANSFRGEINMPLKDLIGRTHVTLHRDEEVCEHVAKSSYNTKLEARVIKNAVDGLIRSPLDRLWRDHEDRVSEKMNRRPLTKYMVQLAKDGGDAKIHVFEKGVTEVKDGRCC